MDQEMDIILNSFVNAAKKLEQEHGLEKFSMEELVGLREEIATMPEIEEILKERLK